MKQDVKNKKKSKIKQRVLLYFLSVFLIMLGACYPYQEAPQEQIKENNSQVNESKSKDSTADESFDKIHGLFGEYFSLGREHFNVSGNNVAYLDIPHLLQKVGDCRAGNNSACYSLDNNVYIIKGMAVGKNLANKKVTLIEPGTIGLGEIHVYYDELVQPQDHFCMGVGKISYFTREIKMESPLVKCFDRELNTYIDIYLKVMTKK